MDDDFNTVDELNKEKDKVQHDVPLAVKLGIPALIIALAVAGYFVYGMYQSNKTLDTPVSPQLVVSEDDLFEEKLSPIAHDFESMIKTSGAASALPIEEDALISDGAILVKLSDSFEILTRNVDQINLGIGQAKDDRSLLSEEIKRSLILVSSLRNDLIDLKKEMSALSDTVATQSKKITQTFSPKKKPIKRSVRPPFTLLSIDQWGGKNSAVIGISNKTLITNVGDIRSGWRIDSINHPDCIRVVRVSDAIATNVCRSGERR